MNEPTRAAGNRQQFQKDTEIDRGWGPCDECGATEVSLCHECPAWVWRKDAEAAGWRHDHIGGFGCISLCPHHRDSRTAPEPPRLPAESSPEPPAGPERGTGEAGPETSAQAAGVIPAGLLNCNPRTVIHFTAEEMARAPLTIEIDHEPLLQFEPAYPPATIPNEAMPHLAGLINALKPFHYREVADSLDNLGHHDAARAVRSAAKGLEDVDG